MATRSIPLIGTMARSLLASVVLVAVGLALGVTPAGARQASGLCGSGSPPDYGFTYDRLQEHWTVNWGRYVSLSTVMEVDEVLDRLNADSIAQTMILFQEPDEVGIRVNCAVHFLRYMRLGLPAGERKDNGFAFLIVVEPDSIDIHYGVGLGLPALTAPELTGINRSAEAAYDATGSMDKALLTLVREFDAVTRSNYAPLVYPTPTPVPIDYSPSPLGAVSPVLLCGLLCLALIIVGFVLYVFFQFARAGMDLRPRRGYWGPSDSFGSGGFGGWSGGGWSGGRGGFGGSSGGGRSSGPSMRGGGGSGRSGRGN